MKPLIVAIFLLSGFALFGADEKADPFAEAPRAEADRSKDKPSAEFLSEELLKALSEPRLDKGTNKDESSLIRITILRSFHAPVVLMWYPAAKGQEPSIHVKRVRMTKDGDGNRTYTGLDIDKQVKLLPSQDQNLKTLWENADFYALPQANWQELGTDGSDWIYETAAKNGSKLIQRWNPINSASSVTHSTITKEQLMRESNLTSFGLMVWTLAVMDDENLY